MSTIELGIVGIPNVSVTMCHTGTEENNIANSQGGEKARLALARRRLLEDSPFGEAPYCEGTQFFPIPT